MARIKRVVSNPYHLWAHQGQDEAYNAQRNKRFRGTSAYSYAAHIGEVVTNERGERAYLVSVNNWTVTTAGHLSEVRAACRGLMFPMFEVWHLSNEFTRHGGNVDRYLHEINKATDKAIRARKWFGMYYREALGLSDQLTRYCEFFGIPLPESAPNAHTRLFWSEEIARAANGETLKPMTEEGRKRAAARIAERDRQNAMGLEDWLAGRKHAVPGNLRYGYGQYAYMRLTSDGSEVQTTMGATVPSDHVRRIVPMMLRLVRSGKAWTPNGETIRLGHYSVNGVDEEGTVRVGCHNFKREEIERFAEVLTQ